MRIGIVGSKFAADFHCDSYSRNEHAELVAVAAIDNLGWTRPAVDEFYNLGYVEELRYFVDCVRKNQEPFYGVNGRVGLACIELVQAFYESNRTGKTITGGWM